MKARGSAVLSLLTAGTCLLNAFYRAAFLPPAIASERIL
jgi:hypothetical protein